MELTPVLIVASCCYCLYLVWDRTARRRERFKLYEMMATMTPEALEAFKNANPTWDVTVKHVKSILRPACLLMGLGLGLCLVWLFVVNTAPNFVDKGYWTAYRWNEITGFLMLGFPLLCGGLGLLTAFLIERNKK